ncbi:molybdopterin converting factor subunit 1 [Ideonella livida]|uniref:Molybdopterin synthase sulfur carrier subunit n=1 Tax=Ideonella livida TaxID=2707176 RepID=A0A7C9PFT1_9BURK|nr:molybdopterin converting factor subunit 1 [Ideonella livida]NDY90608.1 molybdopterin converting factor subunit 1 [Ideonella livida]
MQVNLRFFASLREALGAQRQLELPEGATVAQARQTLIDLGDPYASVLAADRAVRAALNQQVCEGGAILSHGDELAFFPPVTGG